MPAASSACRFEEGFSVTKTTLGRLDAGQIRAIDLPRLDFAVVAGFTALGVAASWISDALDELGLAGAIPASTLRPTIAGRVMVGRALTMRNVAASAPATERARSGANGMAEIEAHNLAEPGDVLVVQGVENCSNLGGVSSTIAQRQGTIGAIVAGGIRDVPHTRTIGFPVWSSSVSPKTGKYRLETVEINGNVDIAGIRVAPGDLVYADDDGVCIIPRDKAAAVLALCQKKKAGEEKRLGDIAKGMSVRQLAGK